MSYKIVNNFVPRSKYNIKATYAMVPTTITIHNTANTASARNEVAYMRRNNNMTSYHVAIDDKEVVQAIPFNRNAWAAGDGANGQGNRRSIHVEICYSMDNGYSGRYSPRHAQAEKNAALYVAHVLIQYGWGVDRLRQHWDWSRKDCPHKMRAWNNWQAFKNMVQKNINEIKGGKPSKPSKPIAQPKPSKPSKGRGTGGAGNIKYNGDWRFNRDTQVYWVPVKAKYTLAYDTYAYDKLPKIIKANRLSKIKAGTTIDVVELCRFVEPSGKSYVWAVYRTGKGRLRYLPIKEWNKRPGRVTNSGLFGKFV